MIQSSMKQMRKLAPLIALIGCVDATWRTARDANHNDMELKWRGFKRLADSLIFLGVESELIPHSDAEDKEEILKWLAEQRKPQANDKIKNLARGAEIGLIALDSEHYDKFAKVFEKSLEQSPQDAERLENDYKESLLNLNKEVKKIPTPTLEENEVNNMRATKMITKALMDQIQNDKTALHVFVKENEELADEFSKRLGYRSKELEKMPSYETQIKQWIEKYEDLRPGANKALKVNRKAKICMKLLKEHDKREPGMKVIIKDSKIDGAHVDIAVLDGKTGVIHDNSLETRGGPRVKECANVDIGNLIYPIKFENLVPQNDLYKQLSPDGKDPIVTVVKIDGDNVTFQDSHGNTHTVKKLVGSKPVLTGYITHEDWQKEHAKQTDDYATYMNTLSDFQTAPAGERGGETNGYLHQICTKLGVLAYDQAGKGTKFEIRPVIKKDIRILTKGVQKYGMKISLVLDGFGMHIITDTYANHIKILRALFAEYGKQNEDGTPKPEKVKLRGKNNGYEYWEVNVLMAKFSFSCPKQTNQERFQYRDDKIILRVKSPNGKYVLIEVIVYPKLLKDIKKRNHDFYEITREGGDFFNAILDHAAAVETKERLKSEVMQESRPVLKLCRSKSAVTPVNSVGEDDDRCKSLTRAGSLQDAFHSISHMHTIVESQTDKLHVNKMIGRSVKQVKNEIKALNKTNAKQKSVLAPQNDGTHQRIICPARGPNRRENQGRRSRASESRDDRTLSNRIDRCQKYHNAAGREQAVRAPPKERNARSRAKRMISASKDADYSISMDGGWRQGSAGNRSNTSPPRFAEKNLMKRERKGRERAPKPVFLPQNLGHIPESDNSSRNPNTRR